MEHLYFYEDEVFRLSKKGSLELGIVLQNAEHVSSDEEDEDYAGTVKNGFIRVAWHPSGVEQLMQEKKVGLADRSLMPGDVVRRLIKGKDTQRGYCRNINVKADLQVLGTNQIIVNVPSKLLSHVEMFMPGVVVVLRSFVGTVKSITSRLHLSLPDGSQCIISDVNADMLEDLEERRCDSEFPHRSDYYPGQVLLGTTSDLHDVEWIVPPKDGKSKLRVLIRMVVGEVLTKSVTVHWQCCNDTDRQQPMSNVVEGEDLKQLRPLNVFESCTLEIGDRSFYQLTESDVVLTKEAWRIEREWTLFERKSPWKRKGVASARSEETKTPEVEADKNLPCEGWETDDGDTASVSSGCSSNSSASTGHTKKKKTSGLMTKMLKYKKLRRTRRRPPNVTLKPNERLVVETLMTTSTADVVWQDGTVETNIPSTHLYPIHHLDDQEFFPGDFVVESKDTGCNRMYGVVQSVDHVGRLARVTWFHPYTSQEETTPARMETVEVSVYDLKDHPDFQYRPGTVALRMPGPSAVDLTTAPAGQVLDNYPEGRVHMWWVDGQTSMCWPQDLLKVGDYDSDEGELWDDNNSENSWETESEEELVDNKSSKMKPRLAANIEQARVSMSRLEDVFTHNPGLQTLAVMQKLLEVYRDCRYLDKLMGTSYFHERNFQGMVERVREKNKHGRLNEQLSRQSSVVAQCTDKTCTEVRSNSKEKFEQVNLALESLNSVLEGNFATPEATPEPSTRPDGECPNPLGYGAPTPECHDDAFSECQKERRISLTDDGLECPIPENVPKGSAPECQRNKQDTVPTHINSVEASPEPVHEKSPSLDLIPKSSSPECQRNKHHVIPTQNPMETSQTLDVNVSPEPVHLPEKSPSLSDRSSNGLEGDKSPISVNGEKSLNSVKSSSQDDSGVFDHSVVSADASSSEHCDIIATEVAPSSSSEPRKGTYVFGGSRVSYGGSEKRGGPRLSISIKHPASPSALPTPGVEVGADDSNPCAKLCALIKGQLCLAFGEVYQKFNGEASAPMRLSELEKSVAEDEVAEDAPPTPAGEEMIQPIVCVEGEGFDVIGAAPANHKFRLGMFAAPDSAFLKTVKKELSLLRNALPPGIWVKGYEDRMDLYSIMIRGPEKTPYEDGLFLFDAHLPRDYPRAPPIFHYHSYCADRLNPNLYEDGKVCVSLLGTWKGRGTEMWSPNSTLLQVIVSIQGLILVKEPYYNEAGYEKQKGSQQGHENSRMYNEMAVLKLLQAMTKMSMLPRSEFQKEIKIHFAQNAHRLIQRVEKWLDISEKYNEDVPPSPGASCPETDAQARNEQWQQSAINVASAAHHPDFPLLPASRGFCITMRKTLEGFRQAVAS